MPTKVIVGTQWGDEGKAKVVDYLTKDADIVVRFQGGANAGHTVIVDGKEYIFHLVPAGIIHPNKICVIGNGVVIALETLLEEIDELENKGISVEGRLFISQNAHLVMPYHKLLDQAEEERKGKDKLGTTIRGIGPCYTDKVARIGIRVGDLLNEETLKEKLAFNVREKNLVLRQIYKKDPIDEQKLLTAYLELKDRITPYVRDISIFLNEAIDEGKHILFEGAQATLLDMDHGTYPFVTSSNTVAGAACTGTGIGPKMIDEVIGVAKAYTTRVGTGPFPTELSDSTGEMMRQVGRGEYGTTTGRPRRCGWFDAVPVRMSARVNGLDSLAITKMDVLDSFPKINICTAYRYEGKTITEFPSDPRILEGCEPIYEELDGWMTPTNDIRYFDELPDAAKRYLDRMHQVVGTPIFLVSVGFEREQTVVM